MLFSFSYNLVKVKSKNIFGFKYYLNLGTTSQIINVKGLSEVSIKCTNPESHISKFSEFANIVFYLPKVTSLQHFSIMCSNLEVEPTRTLIPLKICDEKLREIQDKGKSIA